MELFLLINNFLGVSIGSLGDNGSEAHVSDIIVNGATLSGTTNGLRIKTWQVRTLSFCYI